MKSMRESKDEMDRAARTTARSREARRVPSRRDKMKWINEISEADAAASIEQSSS
jgi:hypothetical protein